MPLVLGFYCDSHSASASLVDPGGRRVLDMQSCALFACVGDLHAELRGLVSTVTAAAGEQDIDAVLVVQRQKRRRGLPVVARAEGMLVALLAQRPRCRVFTASRQIKRALEAFRDGSRLSNKKDLVEQSCLVLEQSYDADDEAAKRWVARVSSLASQRKVRQKGWGLWTLCEALLAAHAFATEPNSRHIKPLLEGACAPDAPHTE